MARGSKVYEGYVKNNKTKKLKYQSPLPGRVSNVFLKALSSSYLILGEAVTFADFCTRTFSTLMEVQAKKPVRISVGKTTSPTP